MRSSMGAGQELLILLLPFVEKCYCYFSPLQMKKLSSERVQLLAENTVAQGHGHHGTPEWRLALTVSQTSFFRPLAEGLCLPLAVGWLSWPHWSLSSCLSR